MADETPTTPTARKPAAPPKEGTVDPQAGQQATAQAVNPLPEGGDHDRVAMLSLRADGVPDQYAPEVIIDEDAAVRAAKVQFAEQAVSAADVALTGATSPSSRVTIIGKEGDEPDEVVPLTTDAAGEDPSIAEARKAHEAAQEAAQGAAEATIRALSKDR
jgi:hypothetical protein